MTRFAMAILLALTGFIFVEISPIAASNERFCSVAGVCAFTGILSVVPRPRP
jgi:hypothetical protein